MRKPKYRAWHKSEKKMCDVKVLTDEGAFLVGVLKDYDQYPYGGRFVLKAPKDGRFCYNDEFELMEFTGLTDKNRQELYQDDIISDGEFAFRIYLVPGGFGIKASMWSSDMSDLKPSDELILQALSDCQTRAYIMESCEIIGNIHENSELIK